MSKLETYTSSMLRNSLYGARKGRIDGIIESANDDHNYAKNSQFNNVGGFARNDGMSIYGIPTSEMTPDVENALKSLMGEIVKLKSERVRLMGLLRKSENLADTDPLSGIFNRRAFEREALRCINFFNRYDADACFIFIDLDGFKLINDSFGHQIGDVVIKEVAKVLSSTVRDSDIVGRLGGDEFAILLANTTKEEAILKSDILENKIKDINIEVNGFKIDVNASYGITSVLKNDSLENIIDRADREMYIYKEGKKAMQRNNCPLKRAIQ